MARRVFWELIFLLILLSVSCSPVLASPQLQLILTPSHKNPMDPHSVIVVTIEAKDASGYDYPLRLSQISAIWDGKQATVMPTDVNWPPQAAAQIPISMFTPQYLKQLQSNGFSVFTDDSITQTFQSPHNKFLVCREDAQPEAPCFR